MEVAIYSDCLALMSSLQCPSETPGFDEFCKQWKLHKFHFIYAVQTTNIELIQTTRIILQVAKRIVSGQCRNSDWCDEYTAQCRRIGGVYLMYAAYFKQPTKEYVKIEVSLNTWTRMLQFVENLPPKESYDDVRYTFWRLHEADAFAFTALDYCDGLEGLVDYDKLFDAYDASVATRNDMTLLSDMKEYVKIRTTMPALTILEDGYNEMKEILTTMPSTSAMAAAASARALPASCIFKKIQSTINIVESMLKMPQMTGKTTGNSTRRQLKMKGYKPEQNPESDQNSAELERSSNGPTIPRQSSKTIFSDPLPEETLRDLEDNCVEDRPEDYGDNVHFEITEYLDDDDSRLGNNNGEGGTKSLPSFVDASDSNEIEDSEESTAKKQRR